MLIEAVFLVSYGHCLKYFPIFFGVFGIYAYFCGVNVNHDL